MLDELQPRIIEAVSDALVVIYNAPFDAGFLRFELNASAEVRCAMREFAEVFGEWSDWYGSYRWQKLHVAAAYVGFDWDGASHRAINDCQATRAVWRYLRDPAERSRIDARTRDTDVDVVGVDPTLVSPAAKSITTEPIARSCRDQTDHTGSRVPKSAGSLPRSRGVSASPANAVAPAPLESSTC